MTPIHFISSDCADVSDAASCPQVRSLVNVSTQEEIEKQQKEAAP